MSGSFLAILSAACFALNAITTRRAVVRVPDAFLGVFITVFFGPPLFFLLLAGTQQVGRIGDFLWQGYLLLTIAGIIHFVMGRSLHYGSIQLLGANMANILERVSPLWAVTLAVVLFQEELTWGIVSGSLLIILGAMLVAWDPIRSGHRNSPTHLPLKGVFLGLGAGLFYGTSPLLIKAALGGGHSSPMAATFISYLGASAAMLLLVPTKRSQLVSIDRKALLWFCLSGFMVAIAQLFRYLALNVSPVSVVTPLIAITPLMVITFSFLLNRHLEIFTKKTLIGAATAVSGTIILLYK